MDLFVGLSEVRSPSKSEPSQLTKRGVLHHRQRFHYYALDRMEAEQNCSL